MDLNNAKLFINPESGRGKGRKHAYAITSFFQKRGLIDKAYLSNRPGDLTGAIHQACLDGCQQILIAGGDGSIHEAVNGMMQSGVDNLALGIIPIGTGNDFIKSVGIPNDYMQACEYLLTARSHEIDLGHIETSDGHSAYFINNIGAGFDGKVGLSAAKIPFISGIAVYILALFWHLLKGIPNPFAKLNIDSNIHEEKMTLVAISNGTTYGGTFNIAPDAKIDDGKLDCIFAPARGRVSVLPLLIQLMRGRHLKHPDILFKQCENFSLETNEPIVVIADGELVDESSSGFKVQILKKQLSLLLNPN